jgi:hypothetical protein
MTLPPCFTYLDILIIGIAKLANCRPAFLANRAHLTAWQYYSHPIAFFGSHFRSTSCPPDQLASLPRRHLYIVYLYAARDRFQRHGIT